MYGASRIIETNIKEMVKVRFQPQAWQNDYAIDVDPEGDCTFLVPWKDTVGMRDNSDKSDSLIKHSNAPDWIKNWRGPYYFSIDRLTSH